MATPHLTNLRKVHKAKRYKRGKTEPRSRKCTYTWATVSKMMAARKELIGLLVNENDVDAFINVINAVNGDSAIETVYGDEDDQGINAT